MDKQNFLVLGITNAAVLVIGLTMGSFLPKSSVTAVKEERAAAVAAGVAEYRIELAGIEPVTKFQYIKATDPQLVIKEERAAAIAANVAEYRIEMTGIEPVTKFQYLKVHTPQVEVFKTEPVELMKLPKRVFDPAKPFEPPPDSISFKPVPPSSLPPKLTTTPAPRKSELLDETPVERKQF